MSKRKNPVVKVIPVKGKTTTKIIELEVSKDSQTPGKVIARTYGIEDAQGIVIPGTTGVKKSDKEVKVKGKINIVKDSGQKLKTTMSVTYRLPYIDPEAIKGFYEANPEHVRCINLKANCIIGGGVDIEPIDPKLTEYKNDKEYKLLEDLITKPVNKNDEGLIEVLRAWVADKVNFGWGPLEIVKNNGGTLGEIYYFPAYEARLVYNDRIENGGFAEKVTVIQLINSSEAVRFPIFSEKNFKDKKNLRLTMLLRNMNPFDRFYGFPDWYPATAKLILSSLIDDYNIRSFKNDLMLNFVIIVEGGDIADGQDDAIKTFLSANYKGVGNASKALYLSTDNPDVKVRIEKVQKDGREASFRLTQSDTSQSIIISHGVIASLIGISQSGKLGNTSENYDLFRVMNETVIKPEQKQVADKLNSLIRIGLGITKFKLVPKELTFEKLTEMVKFATELVRENIIDDNEARQYLNYETREVDPNTLADQVRNLTKQVRIIKESLEN